MKKKIFESKFFDGIELNDYWDLGKHPLYVRVDKKLTLYIEFRDFATSGFEKVDSLYNLTRYLKRNEWTVKTRYNKIILHTIQNKLSVHHTV